jgi:serine phosphatase RsbU (regulator of sigma subunit)
MLRSILLITVVIGLLSNVLYVTAQTPRPPALVLSELRSGTSTDTTRILLLHELSLFYVNSGKPDSVKYYSDLALKVSNEIGYRKGIAESYSRNAVIALDQGKNDDAEKWYRKALSIRREIGDSLAVARTLVSIGITYQNRAQYAENTNLLFEALRVLGKDSGQVAHMIRNNIYNNLGNVYFFQNMPDEAEKNYRLAAEYAGKCNDYKAQAIAIYNTSLIMNLRGEYRKALQTRFQVLSLFEKAEEPQLIASACNGIASSYAKLNIKDSSRHYLVRALEINRKARLQHDMTMNYLNLADIDYHNSKQQQAEKYFDSAYQNALKTGDRGMLKEYFMMRTNLYREEKKYDQALDHLLRYVELRDSLHSEDQILAIKEVEGKYLNEKKQHEIEALNKQKKLDDLEIEQQKLSNQKNRQLMFFLSIGIVLVGALAYAFRRNYKQKQRDNEIIAIQKQQVEYQKIQLESKNKEVTDSIQYAKRVQEAILPSDADFKAEFDLSFIFFQPKDIVSGDFYFMEKTIAPEGDELVYVAVGDCTGHGVPGAMVSVVCSTALSRSIKEFGLTDTGKILDKTRELVIDTLAKGQKEIRDGMDISMVCICKNKKTIQWSGANNSIVLTYPSLSDYCEYKADKQPIGKFETSQPFSAREIAIEKGMRLFLFSDGYGDQFGGEKGKKFRESNLKKSFVDHKERAMPELHQVLKKQFSSWKGELEQIDDVCVLGIQF